MIVLRMGELVLGTEWFKNFVRFRENPKFFNQRISSDDLAMHILKYKSRPLTACYYHHSKPLSRKELNKMDLYSDSLSTQCKVHLLLMFQEHPLFLIQDELILEKVVNSFKSLFNSIEGSEEKKLFKSQLLITSTTILLAWETTDESVCKLVADLIVLLLEVIVREKTNHVVRLSACRCLEEIEMTFPGILRDKLDVIYIAFRNLLVPSMQSFAILLSICLKHDTDFLLKRYKQWSIKNSTLVLGGESISSRSYATQVQNILDSILDNVSHMSGTCFYIVFINLIHVIKDNEQLLPTVFKSFVPKIIRSSDILHFHLAFVFQKLFGLELLSSTEEKLLLQQLLTCVCHPCLTITHRLLYLDWLDSCLQSENGFVKNLSRQNFDNLVPGPFDGPHTHEKKIRFLVHYFQEQVVFNDCSAFLLNCLSGLKRQVMVSSSMKTAAAFFRSVFILYSASSHPSVQLSLDKMVLDVVTVSPHLSAYVLDLLNCLKNQNNESFLNLSLLTMLVDHLINLPIQKLGCQLENYLPILEKAAVVAPSIGKPEVIVRQLKKVLSSPNSHDAYKWIPGYHILLMCNTFMKLHDIDILYHGLGELLQLLMKNSKDTHVQVHAKQYYAALTSLSKARIKALCSSQPFDQHQSPLTFVEGKTSKFQSKNVITKLKTPVLQLVRLEKSYNDHVHHFHVKDTKDFSGLKNSYEEYINAKHFQPVVVIPFLLKHVNDVAELYDTVYSVIIEVIPSLPCLKISPIEVPLLTRKNKDKIGVPVNVIFTPSSPYPLTLNFKLNFTTSSGFNYSCSLPSVKLELKDLFTVIPVVLNIPCPQQDLLTKKLLFTELWDHFSSRKNQYCLSIVQLNFNNVHALVEKFWKPFIMENASDSYKIGIFLPPSSHLLLKLEVMNKTGLVTFITDNTTVVPYISLYLQQLANSKV